MPTSYPGALDDTTDLPNEADLTGKKLDGSDGADHDAIHETIHQAVIAIETELGTDPSGSEATVKARIATDETNLANHLADTDSAHAASAVSFTPASGIAATDAQAAIVEAKTDAQTYADSAVSTHNGVTTAHGISSFVAGALDEATVGAFLTALGIDADVATLAVPASTTISAFVAAALDETTLAAFLTALGLDADIATLAVPASTTISAFGATLVDDADAATALATLGAAASSHNHSASEITSGTIAQARLGSGSAGGGAKFLADDQTYKAIDTSALEGGAVIQYLARQQFK